MKIKKYIAFNFDSGKMIAYDKPPQGIGGSRYKNPVIMVEAVQKEAEVTIKITNISDQRIIIH